jgi:hypothetical protein
LKLKKEKGKRELFGTYRSGRSKRTGDDPVCSLEQHGVEEVFDYLEK